VASTADPTFLAILDEIPSTLIKDNSLKTSKKYLTRQNYTRIAIESCNMSYTSQTTTILMYYLAAVISSQQLKHERIVTSGKHEAINASKHHCICFALFRSASPGFFCFSQTASMQKISMGSSPSTDKKDDSLLPESVLLEDFLLFDCVCFRTVSI
jgi:hypothetical protein